MILGTSTYSVFCPILLTIYFILGILPYFTVSTDKRNPGQRGSPNLAFTIVVDSFRCTFHCLYLSTVRSILTRINPCPCRHKAAYFLSWRLRILLKYLPLHVPFPHLHPRSDRVHVGNDGTGTTSHKMHISA